MALCEAGRYQEALPLLYAAFQSGAGPAPDVAEALARASLNTFRLGTALLAIERWTGQDPRNPKPHLWKADIDTRRGASADVIRRTFGMRLGCRSGLPEALFGLAEARRSGGRLRGSRGITASFWERQPDDPARPGRCWAQRAGAWGISKRPGVSGQSDCGGA